MKLLLPLPHHIVCFLLGEITLKGIKEWLELVKTTGTFQCSPVRAGAARAGSQGCVQLGFEPLQGWRATMSLGSLFQCCASPGQALCWPCSTVCTLYAEIFGSIKSKKCMNVVWSS